MDTKQALDLSQTKVQRLEETEQTLLSQLATTKEQNDEMQKEMETLQRELNNSKLEYEVMQKTSEKNDADVSDLKTQLWVFGEEGQERGGAKVVLSFSHKI